MALPDTLQLKAASSRTSGFAATEIANTATGTGSEIDNSANLDALLSAAILYQYASAPTAAKTIKIHLIYAIDGTNYEDVGAWNQIGAISPAADTNAHREARLRNVPLLPFKFKIVIVNVDTAQTVTVTVNAYTHNDSVTD